MLTILVRSLVLVLFAIFSIRLMGKRQVGQLQPFELVIAIMIADLAATPMESLDTPLWRGIVPMLTLVVLHQLLTLLSLKSQKVRAILSGTPTIVITKGKIDAKALEKLCFNLNDLLEELRSGGVLSPSEVGCAIMETSGKLSVFPHSQKRPLCPKDMDIQTSYEGVPMTLVVDGRIERHNLPLAGVSERWLRDKLKDAGYTDLRRVLLCYLDTDGMLTAHGRDDKPQYRCQALDPSDVKW